MADDEDDGDEGSQLAMQVKGTDQTRSIFVKYCPVCTMPPEYCEWGPEYKKCKAWLSDNWKEVFPDVEEDGWVELMTKLGLEGEPDAHAKKAQSAKKPPAEPAPEPVPAAAAAAAEGAEAAPTVETKQSKKDKKKKEAPAVVLELNTRNKKKFTTCIRGLEGFEGIDVPAAAKVFGKKFACGSAFQKGKNGLPDQIEIQGNYKDELPDFLVSKFGISMDAIFALEGGKKVPVSSLAID